MKKSYVNDYSNFIKINYPTFYKQKLSKMSASEIIFFKNTINNAYKTLLVIELIQINRSTQNYSLTFLNEINQLFKRLFHIIPINDQYTFDIFFRAISEACLRLIVSNSNQNSVQETVAQQLSFKSMKEIIIHDSFLFRKRDKFDYLYTLFSTCSKSLHNPSQQMVDISLFDDQFESTVDYKVINSRIVKINKILLSYIIPDIFKMHQSEISLSYSINIKKTMNKTEQLFLKRLPK
ncbi:hypothetical protein CJP45_11195 [Lactobacillus plantarum]|uniref:hypothetical protein n=1 Tax=Lactiplantibacillus plantarum TaxID=1590 RepID=UPI0007BB7A82|nr:hypothetical protein [Lactiplantibacillus plantarum]KZU55139.1 hypothetical protein Nizo2802_1037 [Lactiplantibacillus plantarum]MCG0567679.1 hypothetical protein [Lactiplantibacillus plantarum]MCG0614044.1 hypothetical protein [Lactiplantibacillus plantarum]MCG0709776.1 hypothetical protein [Lactiplantibacillus plantarum]MCG0911451.1 hypothetical protein [Lactiplantibacillus plantarum]